MAAAALRNRGFAERLLAPPATNSPARARLSEAYFLVAAFSFFFFCFSLVVSFSWLFFFGFSCPLAMGRS